MRRDEIKPATLEPQDMKWPTLKQPIVLHLFEQHHRDHRRPFDASLVAAAVRRIVDEEQGS